MHPLEFNVGVFDRQADEQEGSLPGSRAAMVGLPGICRAQADQSRDCAVRSDAERRLFRMSSANAR